MTDADAKRIRELEQEVARLRGAPAVGMAAIAAAAGATETELDGYLSAEERQRAIDQVDAQRLRIAVSDVPLYRRAQKVGVRWEELPKGRFREAVITGLEQLGKELPSDQTERGRLIQKLTLQANPNPGVHRNSTAVPPGE